MRYGKTKSAMLGILILVCAKCVLHTNKFHVFEHSVNKHFKHFICPFNLKQISYKTETKINVKNKKKG
jgi:hypothetical protein